MNTTYKGIGQNNLYPIRDNDVIAIYHETEYKEQDIDSERAAPLKKVREGTRNLLIYQV